MSLRSQPKERRWGHQAPSDVLSGAPRRATADAGITSAPPLIPLALAPTQGERGTRAVAAANAFSRTSATLTAAVASHTGNGAIRGALPETLYYMGGPCTVAEVPLGGRGDSASPVWTSPPPQAPVLLGTRQQVGPATTTTMSVPESALRVHEDARYVLAEFNDARRSRHLPPFAAASTPTSAVSTPAVPSAAATWLSPPLTSAAPNPNGDGTLPLVGRPCTPHRSVRPATVAGVPGANARARHAAQSADPSSLSLTLSGVATCPSPPGPSRAQGQPRRAATPPGAMARTVNTATTTTRPSPLTVTSTDVRSAVSSNPTGVPTLLLVSSLTPAPAPHRSRTARRPVRVAPVAAAASIVERSRAASVNATRRRQARAEAPDNTSKSGPRRATRPPGSPNPDAPREPRPGRPAGVAHTTAPSCDNEETDAHEASVARAAETHSAHTFPQTQALKKRRHEEDRTSLVMPTGTDNTAAVAGPEVVPRAGSSCGEGAVTTPSSQRITQTNSTFPERRSPSSGQSTLTCTDITTDQPHGSARTSSASRSQPQTTPNTTALALPCATATVPLTTVPHTPDKSAESRSWRQFPTTQGPPEAGRSPKTVTTTKVGATTGMPTPEKRATVHAARTTQEPHNSGGAALTRVAATKASPVVSSAAAASPHRERSTTSATNTATPSSATTRATAARSGIGRGGGSSAKHGSASTTGGGTASTKSTVPRAAANTGSPSRPSNTSAVPTTKSDGSKWAQLKARRRRELYAWNEYLRSQKDTIVGDAV